MSIITPGKWPWWKWPNKIGNFTSITKKEEMETFLQDRNQKLQADIIEYKKQNIIRWEKWGNKPKITIGDTTWECDKMEPGRLEIQEENNEDIFKFTLQTWDYLQVGNKNKQIYTDEDKNKELWDLWDKKAVERTEIQDEKNLKLGQEYVCKFSFKIPEGFPLLANRLVIGQWKQMVKVKWAWQNPFLAQRLNRNKLEFGINTTWDIKGNTPWKKIGKKIPIKKFIGKRIDMEYQFKFSDTDDWYLKIYMKWEDDTNHKIVVDYHWPLASGIENKEIRRDDVYFKFWLYRDNYDYGIKKLQDNNKTEANENLAEDIAVIEKAKEDEKNGNPMVIYFKNYSVKTTTQSE